MYQFCYNRQTVISIKFLFLIIVSVGFWSCESGDQQIGTNFIGGNTLQINKIDTFTIKTSTVLLDSIQTWSNTNFAIRQILVGRYNDPFLGNVSCSSFFQLDLNQSFQPSDSAVYDSVVLGLSYNYTFGDTNKIQNIYVRQLVNQIDQTQIYFNTSSVNSLPLVLGSAQFKARPGFNLPLHIKLSDTFGKDILTRAKAGNFLSNQDWLNYFNGIALTSGNSDDASIIGFNSSADSTALRVYYHLKGDNGDILKLNRAIRVGFCFNSILSDRKLTKLAILKQKKDIINSSQTDEQTYIQTGVGIGTRIDFPTLLDLQTADPNSNLVGFNQVTLTIKAIQPLDRLYPLPSALNLNYATDDNVLLGVLPFSFSAVPQNINYKIDPSSNDITYTFDLYQYVNNIVKGKSLKYNGLILTANSSRDPYELNKLVLGSQKYSYNAIKLNVFYTSVPK